MGPMVSFSVRVGAADAGEEAAAGDEGDSVGMGLLLMAQCISKEVLSSEC